MYLYDEKTDNNEIPGFEKTIKPILMALQNKEGKATIEELDEEAIKIMGLPEDVTRILHKGSNRRSEISYRMAWARTYLKKCGLIQNEGRGVWTFTEKFDGNIENIDVDEVVGKVRDENSSYGEETQALTAVESALAFENMVFSLLTDLAKKEGKDTFDVGFEKEYKGIDMVFPEGLEDMEGEVKCIIKYINPERKKICLIC